MNTQIASAAEAQSKVADETNRNVTTISDVAKRTAGIVQANATAGQQFEELATQLHQQVERFIVSAKQKRLRHL